MALQAIAFLAAFGIGLILCLARNPMYGLYVYVLNFFAHPPARWWGAYLPTMRWSLIAAGVTLLAVFMMKRQESHARPLKYTAYVLFMLFVVWMWVQRPWVISPTSHEYGLSIMTKYVVVIYMISVLLHRWEDIENFLFAFVLGSFYLSWIAFGLSAARIDGVGGPGIDDSSSLGMVLAAASIVAGPLFLVSSRTKKLIAAMSVPFLLNGLVLAGSRGAFVGLLAGVGVFFVLHPRGQLRKITLYLVLAAGLFSYLASEFFWDRISTLGAVTDKQQEMDHSALSRVEVFKAQWRMAKDHPLGVGHNGTTVLSDAYIPHQYHATGGGRSSHNTMMSVLVDQGFFGLFLWVGIMLSLYRMIRRNWRVLAEQNAIRQAWINAAVGAAITVLVISSMFSPQIRSEIYVWMIAVTISITNCINLSVSHLSRKNIE